MNDEPEIVKKLRKRELLVKLGKTNEGRHRQLFSKRFSIRNKLIATFLVFILILSIASLVAVNTIARETTEQEIHSHLETVAQSRASHIDTVLYGYRRSTEMMATGIPYRDAVDASKNYTERTKMVNKRIPNAIEVNQAISRIRVLDKNGIIIASTHNDTGFDKSAHEIFLQEKEGTYIGEMHVSEFTGDLVISISSPILVNGNFSGVLVINFNAEEMFDILTDAAGLGETGETYMVNKSNIMISPSRFYNDSEVILKQKVDTSESREWLEFSKEEEEEEREEIDIYESYNGKMVLGTHYRIEEADWCLLAEINEEEAFASIAVMQNAMIIIFSIIILIGMVSTFAVSKSISEPIVRLKKTAQAIGAGQLGTDVRIKSNDEVGDLASSFSKMAKSLKNQQENLENLVAERTKELEKKIAELQQYKKVTVGRELKMVELKKRIKDLEGSVKK